MSSHKEPKMKYPPITCTLLKEKGACKEQVILFRKAFGAKGKASLSKRNAIKYASVFDFGWAAQHLLDKEDLAEYKKARAPILAEYKKALAPILAEYDKALAPILAEYDKACALIDAEYQKAHAPILAEYKKAFAPILAEYDKAHAPILAEYKKACALIDAEYEKARALIFVGLYGEGS